MTMILLPFIEWYRQRCIQIDTVHTYVPLFSDYLFTKCIEPKPPKTKGVSKPLVLGLGVKFSSAQVQPQYSVGMVYVVFFVLLK